MNNIFKSIAWLYAILIVFSCTNVEFQSEYDSQVDFNQYGTYAICTDDLDIVDLNHSQFDNLENRLLIAEVMTSELNAIGFFENADEPDLEAGFKIIIKDQLAEVKSCGSDQENEYWTGCKIDIHEYTEGTLVLRLTDLDKKQVVWEGSAKGILINDQEKLQQIIERTVEQLFSTFSNSKIDFTHLIF